MHSISFAIDSTFYAQGVAYVITLPRYTQKGPSNVTGYASPQDPAVALGGGNVPTIISISLTTVTVQVSPKSSQQLVGYLGSDSTPTIGSILNAETFSNNSAKGLVVEVDFTLAPYSYSAIYTQALSLTSFSAQLLSFYSGVIGAVTTVLGVFESFSAKQKRKSSNREDDKEDQSHKHNIQPVDATMEQKIVSVLHWGDNTNEGPNVVRSGPLASPAGLRGQPVDQ
ncbi:hypothetical protein M427DRAFT_55188 [Gonapodya prolifera JEL478]|uniref:Uncharacterized protein n=1 Tax=Gonapodya prolifera (strain JEL478) TaxID=1344416 RepID=A0A139AKA3_GONPJ|nr:hypothetical protein M427DRAFT_55188 [Gonapodya prolifera JEL478]|eukprot:KXS16855.1 hypothetical protein M427DRAFT_55188 [Gonapodya prolifera JEL478]